MKRLTSFVLLFAFLMGSWLPFAAPVAAVPPRQAGAGTPAPTSRPAVRPADVKAIMDRMTSADKVGQLFLVTFEGSDTSVESEIASLVRDYRVGGVVLRSDNDNFRNGPRLALPITVTQTATGTVPVMLDTPQQIARLSNALQALAMSQPRLITTTISASGVLTATEKPATGITSTQGFTGTGTTQPITLTGVLAPTISPLARPAAALTATSVVTGARLPLLIGLEWTGDDGALAGGANGFSPLASAMALGATWTPPLADSLGQAMGKELQAVGVNLLLGPPLDVLDTPRPGSKGDLDTRTFGGDPFWVGQMGQAFIRGVQSGSKGAVQTAAMHFPGQGSSDRRPEDEVATVQKSMQQLRQIELAPFASVTASAPGISGTTSALMTSHIRYRGFQGNIRELTKPISLAPQLQDLMGLKEFADWRAAGGVLISDALGVPAIRRHYDPQLQKFPHRQVAQDAFLAGNDLLYLSRFALTDDWRSQLATMKETILFFQSKYQDDGEFRARVDAAVAGGPTACRCPRRRWTRRSVRTARRRRR
ncbi:MAG: hypothetical protein MUC51_15545 [Anaerolineae bacterium]|nr:hypothetical protein [Anaerolineae bacterium]